MRNPYYCVMQALSLIKGPFVDDWKDEQIDTLIEITSRTVNPIGRDQEVLWTDFLTAFDSAFADTTLKQKAHNAIQKIGMNKDDLDTSQRSNILQKKQDMPWTPKELLIYFPEVLNQDS
jgi:hypothetical protein